MKKQNPSPASGCCILSGTKGVLLDNLTVSQLAIMDGSTVSLRRLVAVAALAGHSKHFVILGHKCPVRNVRRRKGRDRGEFGCNDCVHEVVSGGRGSRSGTLSQAQTYKLRSFLS